MTGSQFVLREAPRSDGLPGEASASFCSHLGARQTVTAITR